MRPTTAESIRNTLTAALEQDEDVLLLGESVGRLGGVHQTSAGLLERFGEDRVVDTPLSEAGAVGLAVGLALGGKKPVVELVTGVERAAEQLAEAGAHADGDEFPIALVLRVPVGDLGDATGACPEGLLCELSGVRVVAPICPASASAALTNALASRGPTVVLETRSRFDERDAPSLPTGDDVTVVTWGAGLDAALEAAEQSAASIDLVALTTLAPLDLTELVASVQKTGRLVVVGSSRSYADRVLQTATREAFLYLESPPAHVVPQVTRIVAAIDASTTF
ncbi:MAG: hypothetical protein GY913_34545 [Proteobacteria bacterium]|nr:hypothetical protein [Pseudomonadota bacterium]MCP4922050.1 hypothetical protein [Pseudomonadota bacterium]